MKFYSTNNPRHKVSFREAVIEGLPSDNGLFFPEKIPVLPASFYDRMNGLSLPEIGFEVLKPFASDDIPEADLHTIVSEVLNFNIPLIPVEDSIYALELFHGPTLAFKDVGARFLARCLGYFSIAEDKKVTVLVATSGDTGSAVGQGFLNVPNVDVVILYPSGKVSPLQEKQLTTLGGNITALEINGTFDDCQRMVKNAFLDKDLRKELLLTSANSINIARWLPQSVYYFWAVSQVKPVGEVIFSVPSGNYGNLTAGLLAKAMGLGIKKFLAASNANKVVPEYLHTGRFNPAPSIATLSNAMDVGNPSNFPRMLELYQKEFGKITSDIEGFSFSDEQTVKAVKELYHTNGYMMDPHGAIGYLALKEYNLLSGELGIFLETAHPGKFDQTMNQILDFNIDLPASLSERMKMTKNAELLDAGDNSLKNWLLQN